MSEQLKPVKVGLALVFLGLAFGIGMGVAFGLNENMFLAYVERGIQAHPDIFSEQSAGKIWRYAQRAHFHAGGIAAFSLGLIILVVFSSLKTGMKTLSSTLIGLSGFYPLSWFSMFVLAPSIGTKAAHQHLLTESFTYLGVGGLLLGALLLAANLFLGLFTQDDG